ncbi:MAG: heavy metal sensor histidine kinase [Dehalococcoidia bacterium]|nr:heavy metal sensor histidine kinase [Dehalococcoidia bacterium]
MPAIRSLRLRLTLWYVLLLAIILAAFSAGIYLTLRHNLNDSLDDSIRNRANVLLDVLRYEDGRPTLAGVVSPSDPNEGESFVRVFDASGGVTFDSSTSAGEVAFDRSAVESALSGETRSRNVSTGDESFRVRTLPIEQGGRISGVLEVGESRGDVSDTLRILLVILAVAYPLTLAVASFGGVFLAGRALSPIDRLTGLARRISAEDLSQRLDLKLPDDEVGRLARTFDEMIARLDAAFRRQREFTADASHELRTPLTAIKGQVEVALGKPRDADSYREVLQVVNEEVDRMIRLVGSLLTLARADAGQIPIASEAVNLPELVAAAVEQARPAMERRDVELHLEPGPAVTLQADEDLLLQLLLNLLDNAGKYTRPGGRVTVGWAVGDGQAEVWVRDTGVGIAPEHLPHIFDRFYRVDKARSRAEGGSGLGLSICRWIAEAHGGSIAVESAPGEGTAFVVKLPVGARASAS